MMFIKWVIYSPVAGKSPKQYRTNDVSQTLCKSENVAAGAVKTLGHECVSVTTAFVRERHVYFEISVALLHDSQMTKMFD